MSEHEQAHRVQIWHIQSHIKPTLRRLSNMTMAINISSATQASWTSVWNALWTALHKYPLRQTAGSSKSIASAHIALRAYEKVFHRGWSGFKHIFTVSALAQFLHMTGHHACLLHMLHSTAQLCMQQFRSDCYSLVLGPIIQAWVIAYWYWLMRSHIPYVMWEEGSGIENLPMGHGCRTSQISWTPVVPCLKGLPTPGAFNVMCYILSTLFLQSMMMAGAAAQVGQTFIGMCMCTLHSILLSLLHYIYIEYVFMTLQRTRLLQYNFAESISMVGTADMIAHVSLQQCNPSCIKGTVICTGINKQVVEVNK